jgi:hypothetical protein
MYRDFGGSERIKEGIESYDSGRSVLRRVPIVSDVRLYRDGAAMQDSDMKP